jgi:soluble lytic murein transglycosylase-like protein
VSARRRVRRDGLPAMLLFVAVPFTALVLAMGAHPAGLIDSEDEIRARTEEWRPKAAAAASEAGVPLDLLLALVASESSGRPTATSSAGCLGLTQLMPSTARGMAARMKGLDPESLDLFDPDVNLRIGAAVLADELRTFGQDPALALAAYHRGPADPAAWRKAAPGRKGIDLVLDRAPPATRDYVATVIARRKWFSKPPPKDQDLPAK